MARLDIKINETQSIVNKINSRTNFFFKRKVKKFMVNRQDYLIETKRNESGSVNIQKIVDK